MPGHPHKRLKRHLANAKTIVSKVWWKELNFIAVCRVNELQLMCLHAQLFERLVLMISHSLEILYQESSLLLMSLCSFFLCLPEWGQLTTLSQRHRDQFCYNVSCIDLGKDVKLNHPLTSVWITVGFYIFIFNGTINLKVTCLQI